MFNSTVSHRILLGLALIIGIAGLGRAQTQDPAERQRAIDLYESQNMVGALPLLEKVALAYPNDTAVLSRLGFALYAASSDEKDPAKRQQMRQRAQSILRKAQSLGDKSSLVASVIEALSEPDTSQVPFSQVRAADSALREGEAAFVRGELDKAVAAYKRALDADPHLYLAAVFAGDSEYKNGLNSTDPQSRSQHFDAAGVWFAKAIAIDANREIAYRYWGDTLDAQGKTNDALVKFVDAIVAEPYSGDSSYVGLIQWGKRHQVQIGHPHIEPPSSATTQGNQTTINIDPRTLDSKDGSNEWLMYGITRAAWQTSEFAKNYPNEQAYRHSLKEEVAALRMVAEACAKDVKSGRVKTLEPSLETLVKLNDGGLLEAFVLFARPDQGIARDYAAYRATNREKLRRYWLEVAVIKG